LKSWNKLNTPELPWRELDGIIKSAVQGKYVYGCTDQILKSQCDREKCPIAPKQIAKLLTPDEKERAERLLADTMLLDYVAQFGRRRLIGEDNTLLTNFVVVCSGQTKYPISSILSGFSGSGKNESIRAIKPLIPNEWLFEFTTSTPEAVKYIPEEFAGTLVIYEIAGMESKTGTLGLRSVGEGESIETIFPMRDEETGKMMLGRHKTNARNFITTESDIDIHADLYRRVLKISLNHSDVLTKRVLAKKLRDAMLPEGLRKKLGLNELNIPYTEKDFQNALRLIDWNVEVVVFPPASLLQLEKLAIKKEQKVALRSQIERILNFIRVLAIIHQMQRIIIEDKEDGSKFVVASAEDFERAMKILAPSIIETVSRLEKRQNEALELIENSSEELWDKNKLAQKLGVSTVTAARILKTLANLGCLQEIQTTKPYSYELIQDREKPKKLVLLEEINEYKTFYEKELQTFLTHILSPYQNLHVRGISLATVDSPIKEPEPENAPLSSKERQCDKVPVEPTPNLFAQKKPELLFNSEMTSENEISKPTVKIEDSAILYPPSTPCEKVRNSQRNLEKASESKNNPEGQISRPMRSDFAFFKPEVGQPKLVEAPKGLLKCEFCAEQGKPMFFATKHDLELHIKAFHGGYTDTKPDYVK
jgi:predicted transcriptional regulator